MSTRDWEGSAGYSQPHRVTLRGHPVDKVGSPLGFTALASSLGGQSSPNGAGKGFCSTKLQALFP